MASSQDDEQNELPKRGRRKQEYGSDEVYCYCREPAGDRFMIGCDQCNEWYHGECIQLSSHQGRKIDKYYCPTCMSKDPDLATTFKKKDFDPREIRVRCTECINCCSQPDCGECGRCKEKNGRCMRVECLLEKSKAEKKKDEEKRHHRKPSAEVKYKEDDDEEVVFLAERKIIARGEKGWKRQKKEEKKRRLRELNVDKENTPDPEPRDEPFHCWGIGCQYAARRGSKYCSDACGLSLAKERLRDLKKAAENHWRVEPVDERQDRESKEQLRQELEALLEEKKNLDKYHQLIVGYINAFRAVKPEPGTEDDQSEGDFSIHCPVCGKEYCNKTIAKHLERCFGKTEKKTTFASKIKCIVNPDEVLCEALNKSNATFCKRLRVICPEHYKHEIEQGLMICGWPKVWTQPGARSLEQLFAFSNPIDIIQEGLCCLPKRACKQHVGWISMILGSIDAGRLAYYVRLDKVRVADIIAASCPKKAHAWQLLANQTEYHQPLERILETYEEAEKKIEEERKTKEEEDKKEKKKKEEERAAKRAEEWEKNSEERERKRAEQKALKKEDEEVEVEEVEQKKKKEYDWDKWEIKEEEEEEEVEVVVDLEEEEEEEEKSIKEEPPSTPPHDAEDVFPTVTCGSPLSTL